MAVKKTSGFGARASSVTKTVPFLDGEVTLRKLSTRQARELEKLSKEVQAKSADDPNAALTTLVYVVTNGVLEAADATTEELEEFSIGDLKELVDMVLEYSGLSDSGN
jgi:hypothetical protein